MNKTNIVLIVIILILLAFSYKTHSEIKSLKEYSESCAKENESLKMDLDLLKKRLNRQLLEMQAANKAQKNAELDQKFYSMKSEIDKLKKQNAPHKTQEYKERENKIWEDWSSVIKQTWASRATRCEAARAPLPRGALPFGEATLLSLPASRARCTPAAITSASGASPWYFAGFAPKVLEYTTSAPAAR